MFVTYFNRLITDLPLEKGYEMAAWIAVQSAGGIVSDIHQGHAIVPGQHRMGGFRRWPQSVYRAGYHLHFYAVRRVLDGGRSRPGSGDVVGLEPIFRLGRHADGALTGCVRR